MEEKLAKYIGMELVPDSWKQCLKNALHTMPKKIDWLTIEKTIEILDFYELNEKEFREKYINTIRMINEDVILQQICYLWHYILYIDENNHCDDIWSWKTTNNLYQEHGNYMLPIVSMLSGYERHKSEMKKHNYSEKQIIRQKKNVKQTCYNDKKKYNIEGIRFTQMVWGSFFMKGKLIQIGRLQYELKVTNLGSMREYYDPEKDYIYIHIPEGTDLLEKDVEESLIEAKKYIPIYFPEINMKKVVFFTNTWMLSKELDNFLKEDSNILKFKNRFKILKQEEYLPDFLKYVFKEVMKDQVDYTKLKEETTLQKKMKEYLIKGGKLHVGLGVINEEKTEKN